ncbi:hypothetical protein ILYODFUR_001780 [Ilyodon furcidens]|uniref:Uncharacterized protein n=1 Tax=Ilyodon furcidens TaxID=33524 RepID=A0ABV0UR90_9TELE
MSDICSYQQSEQTRLGWGTLYILLPWTVKFPKITVKRTAAKSIISQSSVCKNLKMISTSKPFIWEACKENRNTVTNINMEVVKPYWDFILTCALLSDLT